MYLDTSIKEYWKMRRTGQFNPITVRYIPYPGGKDWANKPLVTKEKTFKTEKQMQAFLDKLERDGNLHEVIGYSQE